MPSTGHALWTEVGGGIIFVTPGKFAGKHKKSPVVKIMRFGVFSKQAVYASFGGTAQSP